jgi:YD repeat-containing protein
VAGDAIGAAIRGSAASSSLSRYPYDAARNTLSYGTSTLTYNDRGRLATDTVGSTASSFVYNALGQMIEYNFGSTSTMLLYDEAGHILGEYYANSCYMLWEYIWMGDIPVAQVVQNVGSVTVYYIHTDQLNAPRKITLPSTNALVWRWDPHPFGEATPNQNPSGLGTFINNLRFPGQNYTYESGLNKNGARDYDPQTGSGRLTILCRCGPTTRNLG